MRLKISFPYLFFILLTLLSFHLPISAFDACIYGVDQEVEFSGPDQIESFFFRSKKEHDPNLEKNEFVDKDAQKKIRPFLLSFRHPMRKILDSLCHKQRITADEETFARAGFKTLKTGPRSFVRVARHPQLPGYLVKVFLDTVLEEKRGKASWKWLVQRCEGAEKIRAVIHKKKIKNFVVARKWIYCFPEEPSPPLDEAHTRHLALLLVTDMHLVPKDENLHAWKTIITPEHLDELYTILSRARGSSYRPDNIAYTKKGKFAFIDTEYPSHGPDYDSIRKYLSPEMLEYWDKIVKNGG